MNKARQDYEYAYRQFRQLGTDEFYPTARSEKQAYAYFMAYASFQTKRYAAWFAWCDVYHQRCFMEAMTLNKYSVYGIPF